MTTALRQRLLRRGAGWTRLLAGVDPVRRRRVDLRYTSTGSDSQAREQALAGTGELVFKSRVD